MELHVLKTNPSAGALLLRVTAQLHAFDVSRMSLGLPLTHGIRCQE